MILGTPSPSSALIVIHTIKNQRFKTAEAVLLQGLQLKTGQSACVDFTVGWANGSIVNPTLMPSSVGCEKRLPILDRVLLSADKGRKAKG